MKTLRLVLGDQLSRALPSLTDLDLDKDLVLMAEVMAEVTYVKHHKRKIAYLFSAMRHFRDDLEAAGHRVHYITIDQRVQSLEMAVRLILDSCDVSELLVCEPGEYRLLDELRGWQDAFKLPVTVLEDDRFLASHADFAAWADGKKQLRMEFFYRKMRARYQLLMEGSDPAGGKWNYDADNRLPPPKGAHQWPPAAIEYSSDGCSRSSSASLPQTIRTISASRMRNCSAFIRTPIRAPIWAPTTPPIRSRTARTISTV